MKKLFPIVALLALVGAVVLTGCKKEEAPPTPAPDAPTNAPAAP